VLHSFPLGIPDPHFPTPRFHTTFENPHGAIIMAIDTLDILGSDQIGIHLASVGNVLFHPRELPTPTIEKLEEVVQLELAPISIGGSNLIGALLAGNSNGMACQMTRATVQDSDPSVPMAASVRSRVFAGVHAVCFFPRSWLCNREYSGCPHFLASNFLRPRFFNIEFCV